MNIYKPIVVILFKLIKLINESRMGLPVSCAGNYLDFSFLSSD